LTQIACRRPKSVGFPVDEGEKRVERRRGRETPGFNVYLSGFLGDFDSGLLLGGRFPAIQGKQSSKTTSKWKRKENLRCSKGRIVVAGLIIRRDDLTLATWGIDIMHLRRGESKAGAVSISA
jgi:hypothetical protein